MVAERDETTSNLDELLLEDISFPIVKPNSVIRLQCTSNGLEIWKEFPDVTLRDAERDILKHLQGCVRVVRLIGDGEVIRNDVKLFVIRMEYVQGMYFGTILQGGPEGRSYIGEYVRELSSAVSEIHQRGVAHYDLKQRNFMWFPGKPGKLIDFGSARCDELGIIGESGGTPGYRAPEHLDHVEDRDPFMCDVWSFGVMMLMTAQGYLHSPLRATDDEVKRQAKLMAITARNEVRISTWGRPRVWTGDYEMQAVRHADRAKISRFLNGSDEFEGFAIPISVIDCLIENPSDRLTMSAIEKHFAYDEAQCHKDSDVEVVGITPANPVPYAADATFIQALKELKDAYCWQRKTCIVCGLPIVYGHTLVCHRKSGNRMCSRYLLDGLKTPLPQKKTRKVWLQHSFVEWMLRVVIE